MTGIALLPGVRALIADSARLRGIPVVRQRDVPALVERAKAGDARAAALLHIVQHAVAEVGTGVAAGMPKPCATCEQPVDPAGAFSVVAAFMNNDPMQIVPVVVCPDCGTEPDDVQVLVASRLPELWPDLASVCTHPGGRA